MKQVVELLEGALATRSQEWFDALKLGLDPLNDMRKGVQPPFWQFVCIQPSVQLDQFFLVAKLIKCCHIGQQNSLDKLLTPRSDMPLSPKALPKATSVL